MEKKSQYEQVCSKKPATARRERRHDIHQPTHKDKHKKIHEERNEETHPTAEPAFTSTQLGVRWSEDVLTFRWTCTRIECCSVWTLWPKLRGQTEVGAPGAWGGLSHSQMSALKRWPLLKSLWWKDNTILIYLQIEGQDDVPKLGFNG